MDWQEVKAKPKRKTKKATDDDEGHYGGAVGNTLKAGPIKFSGPVGGAFGGGNKPAANKQASNIADFDPVGEGDEEIKYETVTHDCAAAV